MRPLLVAKKLARRVLRSPQTRHSATKIKTENGGILRVSEEWLLVAKTSDFVALRKTKVG
jgi:hypothetical protein